MDFELSLEQRMIVDAARKVGERFGLEYWREIDAKSNSRANAGRLFANRVSAASHCRASMAAPIRAYSKWP